MTQKQALALARKKWGRNAWVKERRNAPGAAEHTQLSTELKAHRETKPERTASEWAAWKKRHDELLGRALLYRCELGDLFTIRGLGTGVAVQGYGNTWEEAVRSAKLI